MDIMQMMKGRRAGKVAEKVTEKVTEKLTEKLTGNVTEKAETTLISDLGSSQCQCQIQPKKEVASEYVAPQWKIYGSHMVTYLPSPIAFKSYYNEKVSETNEICVAAFDMDDTLITTKSGIKFGRGPHDWKWRNDHILPVLKEKVKQKSFVLLIFTNQAAVSVTEQLAPNSKSYKNLTVKIGLMTASLKVNFGNLPVLLFASTGKPRKGVFPRSLDETHLRHRKPESGMWDELQRFIRRSLGSQVSIDMADSYYVGDAAGRDGDHSDVDRGFAKNVGVPFLVPFW